MVSLSEVAAKEIKKIIQDQGLPAEQTKLRVGVKGGGCSGFSYMLDLTEEAPTEFDEQVESWQQGCPVPPQDAVAPPVQTTPDETS